MAYSLAPVVHPRPVPLDHIQTFSHFKLISNYPNPTPPCIFCTITPPPGRNTPNTPAFHSYRFQFSSSVFVRRTRSVSFTVFIMSGTFFRGTALEQDARFADKAYKLLRETPFDPILDHVPNLAKVQLQPINDWIATRITDLLGFEDEVVINYVVSELEIASGHTSQEKNTDPSSVATAAANTAAIVRAADAHILDGKKLQLHLTGFLEQKAPQFVNDLWNLLIEAENNAIFITDPEDPQKKKVIPGVPTTLMEVKKAQLKLKFEQEQKTSNFDNFAHSHVSRQKYQPMPSTNPVNNIKSHGENYKTLQKVVPTTENNHPKNASSLPSAAAHKRDSDRHSPDSGSSKNEKSHEVAKTSTKKRLRNRPCSLSHSSSSYRSDSYSSFSRSPSHTGSESSSYYTKKRHPRRSPQRRSRHRRSRYSSPSNSSYSRRSRSSFSSGSSSSSYRITDRPQDYRPSRFSRSYSNKRGRNRKKQSRANNKRQRINPRLERDTTTHRYQPQNQNHQHSGTGRPTDKPTGDYRIRHKNKRASTSPRDQGDLRNTINERTSGLNFRGRGSQRYQRQGSKKDDKSRRENQQIHLALKDDHHGKGNVDAERENSLKDEIARVKKEKEIRKKELAEQLRKKALETLHKKESKAEPASVSATASNSKDINTKKMDLDHKRRAEELRNEALKSMKAKQISDRNQDAD